jgi:hypothetical protein
VHYVRYFNPYAAFKDNDGYLDSEKTDGGSCIGNSEIVYDRLKELLTVVV